MSEETGSTEILRKLSSITSMSPSWEAIMLIIAEQKETEEAGVCQPELTDNARNFNSGRLSMVKDFKEILESAMNDVEELRRE